MEYSLGLYWALSSLVSITVSGPLLFKFQAACVGTQPDSPPSIKPSAFNFWHGFVSCTTSLSITPLASFDSIGHENCIVHVPLFSWTSMPKSWVIDDGAALWLTYTFSGTLTGAA